MKTRKIAEVCEKGIRLIMIYDDGDKCNPYKVYRKWWDYSDEHNYGWHRKQIGKYADFLSAWQRMYEYYWKEFAGYIPFSLYKEASNEAI